MMDFQDLPQIDVRYSDFGLTGRPDVEYVPDHVQRDLIARLGLRVSAIELAFDQVAEAMTSGGSEPLRYDEDHRMWIPGSVVLRRGASRFRDQLIRAYSGECAVTGTSIPGLLEAAHISPYKGDHTDTVSNGLLLRADIHTLFDLHLLTVLPDFTIRVAPDALAEPYAAYDGTAMSVPVRESHRLDPAVLTSHSGACIWLSTHSEPGHRALLTVTAQDR
ncbi:hypothetical protein GA707_18125 [Nostocoides sp. F2B08]|uniref:HNH endonuclease n=1 Tax=Nostocoides sp. F2B08 TaxID=2653936 RepID=UPI001263532F|nr:HNH endonuclease signature motif containing protein [Tetrasphaera sp. F2B08]KAB7741007.1 hypothetical protein GA707_18125 [Tetrasphaera sp. F2B08]